MVIVKRIALALVVIIAIILGIAATKPATFRVERSATIKAPPEKIAPLISDFHQWPAWSPFEKLDPAMTRTYGGAPSGKGAVYEWSGNGQAGAGRMEITDASNSQVAMNLDFTKPMKSSNTTQFTFMPKGDSTTVTWSMAGPNLFMSKVMSVFFSMDKMIGGDFETGLANLKRIAEK